jgi:hypothetical protein
VLNKNKIIEEEMKHGVQSKKRMNITLGANEVLENILLEQCQQMRSVNMPTSRPITCRKATDIKLRLKIDNFKESNGWLHR